MHEREGMAETGNKPFINYCRSSSGITLTIVELHRARVDIILQLKIIFTLLHGAL